MLKIGTLGLALVGLALVTPPSAAAGPAADAVELRIADGSGSTRDEALRDAFRAAVQETVGVYVASERRLKDDVVEKSILAFSNGFIETYREIPLRADPGRVRVRIAARVRRGAIRARLEEAHVPIREVDGAGLFAEAVTAQDRLKRARTLLEALVEDYPFGLIEAEMVARPKLLEQRDDEAKVELKVRYHIDPARYRKLAAFWTQVLDAIALEHGEYTRSYVEARGLGWLAPTVEWPNALNRRLPEAYSGKTAVVQVMTGWTRDFTRASWRYYVIDAQANNPIWKVGERFPGVGFELLDRDRRGLGGGRQWLNNNHEEVWAVSFGGVLGFGQFKSQHGLVAQIAPVFCRPGGSSFRVHPTYTYRLIVPLQTLRDVHEIRLVLGH